jgi:TetR/AcrR family transcriptional repressor of nem operon
MYSCDMDTRDNLIEATRDLLWERGYAATSPRAILDASGAGQGSMYHHFRGKEGLALAAVQRNADEMRSVAGADLARGATALERIASYLGRERDVLKGCRFGKLAQDPEVAASKDLRHEVETMFAWIRGHLADVIEDGKAEGEFPASLNSEHVAAAIAATLQGGYVLARAAGDVEAFDAATAGVLELLGLVGTRA